MRKEKKKEKNGYAISRREEDRSFRSAKKRTDLADEISIHVIPAKLVGEGLIDPSCLVRVSSN